MQERKLLTSGSWLSRRKDKFQYDMFCQGEPLVYKGSVALWVQLRLDCTTYSLASSVLYSSMEYKMKL